MLARVAFSNTLEARTFVNSEKPVKSSERTLRSICLQKPTQPTGRRSNGMEGEQLAHACVHVMLPSAARACMHE
eukprot:5514718-Pleurochrysis_carterae.AAC.1